MLVQTRMKLTALALALALIEAAGWVGLAEAQPAPKPFGTIKVATFGPSITSLPTQVMIEKGFDAEEGFSIALTPATGSVAITAMVAGDFDLTLSPGSALTAGVRGVPLKVIYVHVAKSLYFLYAADGIKTLKDLERKRIAIDAVGGSQDIAVRQAMQDAGADHSKSTFIAMGFQNTPPSMIAGAVDAGVLTPPSEFQLKNSARKFINLGFLGDLTPGLTGGIATADRVIRERPEMLRAVLRAHTKAHRFVLENREQTVAIMSKFLNLSMEDAAESYDSTVRPHYNATGIIPADTQRAFIEERVRALKLKKAPENARIFDLSFVPN